MNTSDHKWLLWGVLAAALAVLSAVSWPPAAAAIAFIALACVFAVRRPNSLLYLAVSAAVLASAGVGVRFFGGAMGAGYSRVRYLVAGIAVVIVLLFLVKIAPKLGRELWLVLLLTFALLSLSWSTNVRESAMLLGGMISAILIGSALGSIFERSQAAKLILYSISLAAGVSLVLVLVAPAWGTLPAPRPGGYIVHLPVGIFAWNSEMGFASAVAAVMAISFWLEKRQFRYLWLAAVMMVATITSDSATAILSLCVGMVVVIWIGVRKARIIIGPPVVVLAILSMAGLSEGLFSDILGLLGRTSDLTGRAVIWPLVLSLSEAHPIFGYGIGAGPDLSGYLGFDAHAHNGYLQLLMELGYVGALLFAGSLIFVTVRVVRSRDVVLAGVLAVFVVANSANNFLLSPHLAVILYAWCAVASVKSDRFADKKTVGAKEEISYPRLGLLGRRHLSG